jgi:hypothetical protein
VPLEKKDKVFDYRVTIDYYTANVCRDLRGLYGEMSLRGFQIYRDYR